MIIKEKALGWGDVIIIIIVVMIIIMERRKGRLKTMTMTIS
jgi:hypothetical protein